MIILFVEFIVLQLPLERYLLLIQLTVGTAVRYLDMELQLYPGTDVYTAVPVPYMVLYLAEIENSPFGIPHLKRQLTAALCIIPNASFRPLLHPLHWPVQLN